MATDAQLLDFDGVSMRVESFTFDLLDAANNKIGSVTPTQPVTMENDSTQGIKRRLSNFHLTPDDTAAIDVLKHRIKAWMVLSNGSRYNLGTFLWADALVRRVNFGVTREGSLGDLGILLAQTLTGSRTIDAGQLCTDAIASLAAEAGITATIIDPSSATVGSPLTFQGGQTSTTYITVMTQLCSIAGFLNPYFLSTGELRCRTAPDLTSATPTLTYVDGYRIAEDSMVESNDMLTAPNRYRVVDTSATTAEVYGEYILPSTYPNSYANRGFYITARIEVPGVGTNEAAAALAQTHALTDPKAYETVQWVSPLDPRHETFDVVNYRGNTYMELAWGMDLIAGGHMSHTAKRIYLT